jgi:hypothetical protein
MWVYRNQPLDLQTPIVVRDYTVQFERILVYVGSLQSAPSNVDTAYYLLGTSVDWTKMHFKSPLQVHAGDRVEVHWGVDSLTQVSGAMHGDLDPQHGMYWAWQSGYIAVKMEGRYTDATGKSRAFTFHLGGYRTPGCFAESSYVVNEDYTITFHWDVDALLAQYDFRSKDHLMLPGNEATQMFLDIIPHSD